jgi:GDP/UDP-N,N'-diacetylbacillosamine 2-epimerase (hydrolysing)
MNISVLSSSRADYGIYLPLLKALDEDDFFNLKILAFGMHLSQKFGMSVKSIQSDFPGMCYEIHTPIEGSFPGDLVDNYASTVHKFGEYWKENKPDLILCLGDRFEMSAAVQSTIPFDMTIAHIHGGEFSEGAIDNIYRDQITRAAKFHFCTTPKSAKRIKDIIGLDKGIIETVGSLSLESLDGFSATPFKEWKENFKLNGIKKGFILLTIHPETKNWEMNSSHVNTLKKVLNEVSNYRQIVVTMPNADTMGDVFRNMFIDLNKKKPDSVFIVENFGTQGYFSAITYSGFLMGNTSSGIIEAASFGKYVLNIGDRQKGRERSKNIKDVDFNFNEIVNAINIIERERSYKGTNIYYQSKPSKKIIQILKNSVY